MKRLFVFLLILTAFCAPALAQDSSPDPAAYLPADLPGYLEIHVDSDGISALNQLATLGYSLAGRSTAPVDAVTSLNSIFPAVNLGSDVLPWVGDRIGIGFVILPSVGEPDAVAVLPIDDPDAAQAFVTKMSVNATTRMVGGVSVYETTDYGLVVGSDVMWLGDPMAIDAFLQTSMFQRLTDNAHFHKTQAALPADAPVTGYVSGAYLLSLLAQQDANIPPGQPSLATIAEAALRLHPAQSAVEDGLLAATGIDGIGFAFQVSDGRIDLTAALSVAAHYPAPTLTSATAGTALLGLVPNDSFVVFDSYDVSAAALPLFGLTYLGTTAVGGTFTTITASLDTGEVLTPTPTPSPTPTPTPLPPMTVDALIAQVQPGIQQIESLMGLSLDQLYSLTNGEYAVAVFPGAGPTLGAALYLQSSDPQKLIDTLDHVSKLFLTDPTTGAQVVTIHHQTMDGIDVALVGESGLGDRPALGIVNGNVLFITFESSVTKVINAATANASTTPALAWRDAFGSAQEAVFYLDPRTVDLYVTRQQRNPPLPLTALAGSLDLRDDGLFVLRLAATNGAS